MQVVHISKNVSSTLIKTDFVRWTDAFYEEEFLWLIFDLTEQTDLRSAQWSLIQLYLLLRW